MAHPSRAADAHALRLELNAQGVTDVPTAMDGGCGIIVNCQTAWLMHDATSDFHFVLQDDAILCRNFVQRVNDLINGPLKSHAYSLYMGRRQQFLREHRSAARAGFWKRSLRWGVAAGLQTSLIPEMLDFYDKQVGNKDDNRIKKYLLDKGYRVLYPVPSLVDHRVGPSLVGDPGLGRKAYWFIDNER